MEARLLERKKHFLVRPSLDDTRQKRVESQARIRKRKREALLFSRRQEVKFDFHLETDSVVSDSVVGPVVSVYDLGTITKAIMSDDEVNQYAAVQQIRQLLSQEEEHPVRLVIECNTFPRIVEFLDYHHHPGLQLEAAWVLTNITSGSTEQTKTVVDAQAIPKLVALLFSPKRDIVEKAVCALGNIAADSPLCRDLVLEAGCVQALMKVLEITENPPSQKSVRLLCYALWALTNLCSGYPYPEPSAVLPVLPTIRNLLSLEDKEVLIESCFVLYHMTRNNHCFQGVVDSGVCPQLVSLLDHKEPFVLEIALRTVCHIDEGNNQQTQAIIAAGGLPCFQRLLLHSDKTIRGLACWNISSICAGNRDMIQSVIDANLIPSLLHVFTTNDDDMKKEAAWAISYAASVGSVPQVENIVSCGCLQSLSDVLNSDDLRTFQLVKRPVLYAIEMILKAGRRKQEIEGTSTNPYVGVLEKFVDFSKLKEREIKYSYSSRSHPELYSAWSSMVGTRQ